MADALFTVRNLYHLGAYDTCITEAEDIDVETDAQSTEKARVAAYLDFRPIFFSILLLCTDENCDCWGA